jgi:hypothetical protein
MGGSALHTGARSRALRSGLVRVALSACAVGLVAVPVAASAQVTPKKSLLQQGLDFYKGKTITLISPDAVGGGFDLTSRAIAPYIAQYLGATVNVTNDSPANTIAGQDLFEASPADGLTLGMINAGADIEDAVTGTAGVNFNAEKTQFLGGNNTGGAGISCLTPGPFQSWGAVVNSTTPVPEVVISTGTQTLEFDLTNAAFGINAKVISGYASTSAEVQGLERGDGQCSTASITTGSFGPFLQAGKATEILEYSGVNPATAWYQYQTNALLLPKAYTEFPAKTKTETEARVALSAVAGAGIGHEFNFQPRVANYKVTAMRAALKAALTNIKCEDALLAVGQQNGFVTPTRALNDYKVEYTALKKVKGLIETALGI